MLRNVFTKGLYDQRRSLIGWALGIVALLLVEGALWPSIRSMPNLDAFLANYPEAFRKLFNLQDFGTGRGFINAELFSAMVPILFIIFAIGHGARAIAGEEEAGTLDVLLATPISNVRLVLEQAATLAASVASLAVVLWASTIGVSLAFGMGMNAMDLLWAVLAIALLGLEFGWLALAVGAITGRRSAAIAAATIGAVAAYVLFLAAQLVDGLKPWRTISPFYQALHGGPLGGGLSPSFIWLLIGGAAVVALSLPIFDRRDIGAH